MRKKTAVFEQNFWRQESGASYSLGF